MYVKTGNIHPAELQPEINRISPTLRPDVINIHWRIGVDVMGSTSVFFNIELTDAASQRSRLRDVAQRVTLTLMNELQTDENGVHAYFNFRSHSEVAAINDPAWA